MDEKRRTRKKRSTRQEITHAWDKEHYTQMACLVRKDLAEDYKAICRQRGVSYASYMKQAIQAVVDSEAGK